MQERSSSGSHNKSTAFLFLVKEVVNCEKIVQNRRCNFSIKQEGLMK